MISLKNCSHLNKLEYLKKKILLYLLLWQCDGLIFVSRGLFLFWKTKLLFLFTAAMEEVDGIIKTLSTSLAKQLFTYYIFCLRPQNYLPYCAPLRFWSLKNFLKKTAYDQTLRPSQCEMTFLCRARVEQYF